MKSQDTKDKDKIIKALRKRGEKNISALTEKRESSRHLLKEVEQNQLGIKNHRKTMITNCIRKIWPKRGIIFSKSWIVVKEASFEHCWHWKGGDVHVKLYKLFHKASATQKPRPRFQGKVFCHERTQGGGRIAGCHCKSLLTLQFPSTGTRQGLNSTGSCTGGN